MYKIYKRKGQIEARPATQADRSNYKISFSSADRDNLAIGTFKIEEGMIARNPDNHEDQWFINPVFFANNYYEES